MSETLRPKERSSCRRPGQKRLRPWIAGPLMGLVFWSPAEANLSKARPGPLTSLEQNVVDEINAARTHPDAYASLLESWRGFYQGRKVVVPRDGVEEVEFTDEGLPALDEAIAALRSAHPVPTLQLSEALCHSARDLAQAQGPTGQVGHIAPDGSDPMVRARRYLTKPRLIGECISYGRDTGKDVVRHLLIDDGVKDRGHRKNLLDPRFRLVGVACGPHTTYGTMCVIDLGERF